MKPEQADKSFTLQLFGTLSAGDAPLPVLRTRKGYLLLAMLALRNGQPIERTALISALWPESEEQAGAASLRRALTDLRRVLEPWGSPLTAQGYRTLQFDVARIPVDVLLFDALAAKWQRSGEIQAARQALALYRGPLLEGFEADWILPERTLREQMCLSLLEAVAHRALTDGDPLEAVTLARRAEGMDPFRETIQRLLYEALSAMGDFPAAERAYRAFRSRLHRETGQFPDASTTQTIQRLRAKSRKTGNGAFSQSAPTKPTPVLRLPSPLTPFFGRDMERERLHDLLCSPRVRLIALTGPGGIGKTRLAITVARDNADAFAGGVWFVSLMDVADARTIPEVVRDVLELPRTGSADPTTQIIECLANKACLLILDNLEPFLPDIAGWIENLLAHLPSLKVLLTSRQSTRIPGEYGYPVPPLPVPEKTLPLSTPESLLDYAGIALFVERATARRADFALTGRNAPVIAAVCSALEGIPLALELAAAWSPILTPRQILSRLEERFPLLTTHQLDIPERHRSLHSVLEASYRLLPMEIQRFFARLSVFRGGWTAEAAEAVAEEPRALEYLMRLREFSLIDAEEQSDEMRFRFLETIREFATHALADEDTRQLSRRHRYYFLSLAASVRPQWEATHRTEWIDVLARDEENLRQALREFFAAGDDPDAAVLLVGLLSRYWFERGGHVEARPWFEKALALTDGVQPEHRALCLYGVGLIGIDGKENARAALREAESIQRAMGDRVGLAWTLQAIGNVKSSDGDFPGAEACFQEAISLISPETHYSLHISLLRGLGTVYVRVNRYNDATVHLEAALTSARLYGDFAVEGRALHVLGNIRRESGSLLDARRLYTESLEIHRRLGIRQWEGYNLFELGLTAQQMGDRNVARQFYLEAFEIAKELQGAFMLACCWHHLGEIALVDGDRATAGEYLREALSLRWRFNYPRELAFTLEAFAQWAQVEGDAERAVLLLMVAATLREKIGSPLPPINRAEIDRLSASLRTRLGPERYATIENQAMVASLDETIQTLLLSAAPSHA